MVWGYKGYDNMDLKIKVLRGLQKDIKSHF